jgi:hypothetical protein
MYPDQNQYSIDYLNQIAPESKKPGLNNKLFFLLIGGGLFLVIIIGLALLSGGTSSTTRLETLAARLQTLETISTASQKNLKSGVLRSTNSNLSIFLTNANRDIVSPLSKNNIKIKSLDKKIVISENGSALSAKLEDARLNAVFDRTYAREMSYQLATVSGLMKDIYTSTKSVSLKDFLVSTDANLQPIQQQLTDFNVVNR